MFLSKVITPQSFSNIGNRRLCERRKKKIVFWKEESTIVLSKDVFFYWGYPILDIVDLNYWKLQFFILPITIHYLSEKNPVFSVNKYLIQQQRNNAHFTDVNASYALRLKCEHILEWKLSLVRMVQWNENAIKWYFYSFSPYSFSSQSIPKRL